MPHKTAAEHNVEVIHQDLEALDRTVLQSVMSALGRRGRGEAKARGGRAAWARMSPEERSAEMRRRASKRRHK